MMMLRGEPKALVANQLRRAFSSRSALTGAGMKSSKTPQSGPTPAAAAAQQRNLLNATTTSPIPSTPFHPMMVRDIEVTLPEIPLRDVVPHRLVSCKPVNEGKQMVLEFEDHTRYEVHSAWLKDSSPERRGPDFYRTSAADVWQLGNFKITGAEVSSNGHTVSLKFDNKGVAHNEVFETQWLHAFAPFVGKSLDGSPTAPASRDTGSLFDHDSLASRRSWRSDVEMPRWDAKTLASSIDAQVNFLETMIERGIGLVTGMDIPESLEREHAGQPMFDLVFDIIGRLNQHPVRKTNWGVIRKTADSAKQGADYDMSNPLSMHTDHSVYHGTPGFLQFLYQAQGNVRSKVCDGLALAEYVQEHHPEAYELLTTVSITHSSRNTLYTPGGAPRDVHDKTVEPAPFELVHTHPVIQLDANGKVEKVVQSETKRGVSAIPYDIYQPFMEAYELWTNLCEDPRFVKHFDWPEGSMVVTNNWRTLHGRASVPPGMPRTLAFGYVNKVLVENRYRLLKQWQTERVNPALDHRWLTRIPNTVLDRLVVKA